MSTCLHFFPSASNKYLRHVRIFFLHFRKYCLDHQRVDAKMPRNSNFLLFCLWKHKIVPLNVISLLPKMFWSVLKIIQGKIIQNTKARFWLWTDFNWKGWKMSWKTECKRCQIMTNVFWWSRLYCDNYVRQWWDDLDDELSWLFTKKFRAFYLICRK